MNETEYAGAALRPPVPVIEAHLPAAPNSAAECWPCRHLIKLPVLARCCRAHPVCLLLLTLGVLPANAPETPPCQHPPQCTSPTLLPNGTALSSQLGQETLRMLCFCFFFLMLCSKTLHPSQHCLTKSVSNSILSKLDFSKEALQFLMQIGPSVGLTLSMPRHVWSLQELLRCKVEPLTWKWYFLLSG